MEKQKTSKREWVKTFAIIFLVILLILTFFSNTIMNRSLPEVATQSVTSGAINAKIRGTGTVSANETYDVTISQTRKIRSVLVKVGDQVSAGDPLFMLEASESDELKQAQDSLDQMVLSYQKSLIEASNSSSTENREVQKLREAYNEALETYRLYSTADPSQITRALEQAKVALTDLQRVSDDAQEAYSEAASDREYTQAQQDMATYSAQMTSLDSEIEGYESQLEELRNTGETSTKEIDRQIEAKQAEIQDAKNMLARDQLIHGNHYSALERYARETAANSSEETVKITMAAYAADKTLLRSAIAAVDGVDADSITDEELDALSTAYEVLTADKAKIAQLEDELAKLQEDKRDLELASDTTAAQQKLQNKINEATQARAVAEINYNHAERTVDSWENKLERLDAAAKEAKRAAEDQQALVEKYTQASSAASTLKAAEEALEEKVFTVNLGDSGSLDLQAAKKAIEEQEKLVEELTSNADGQEVTANVSGVISAINVTAGNTAGAETALATITVADRGYTVNISVTNDQAKQVKIGDAANISNYYYGDLTATLENIINDPQAMGKGKILVFRLSGDVEAGSNITLSIGQRSANYDAIVPNSALRSDANGDFVLVVTSKSSPLGNRYVATRADVQKLASDDTTTAVSGLAAGDFVITTSTKPIEAGEQVRLVDNG